MAGGRHRAGGLFGAALLAPGGAWLAALFAAPFAVILVYSFWRVADYNLVPDFTLANYLKFGQSLYRDVTLRTLRVGFVTTAISLVIAYPVAYWLARHVRRFRLTLLMLVVLPLWTSYLVRTFAWLLILGRNGIANSAMQSAGLIDAPLEWILYSDFAVTLALVHIYMPFMVVPLYASLERLDGSLLEAAWDLGAGPVRSFVSVVLPLSLPGAATGCAFVFISAAGAFVTPELLGGTRSVMLGNIIAQQFGVAYEYPLGSALSIGLMAAIVAAVALLLRYGRPRGVVA